MASIKGSQQVTSGKGRPRRVIGLDIATTAVRAVMVESYSSKDRSANVVRMMSRPISGGAVSDGKISNPRIVAATVSSVLADIKAGSTTPIAVAVSGRAAALTWFRIPKAIKPEERLDFVRANLKSIGTMRTEEAALSIVPVANVEADGREETMVAIAAANRQHLTALEYIFDDAKGRLAVVDLSSSALLRSMTRPEGNDVMCVVDVGDSHTTIAMRLGSHLRLSETVSKGGSNITSDLVGATDLDESTAEQLKRTLIARDPKIGSIDGAKMLAVDEFEGDESLFGNSDVAVATKQDEDIQSKYGLALTVAVDSLCDEIASVIESAIRDDKVPAPDGVVLTGGGSLVKGFNMRLQDRLGRRVHGALPWATYSTNEFTRQHMTLDPSTRGRKEQYIVLPATERAFAVAIGMAMTPMLKG